MTHTPPQPDEAGGRALRIAQIRKRNGLALAALTGPDRIEEDRSDLLHWIACAEDDVATLLRDIAALDAALQSISGAEGWRTIETAPKDGTRILGCYLHQSRWVYRVTYWRALRQTAGDWLTEDGKWRTNPTHWQPLPPPPSPATEKE